MLSLSEAIACFLEARVGLVSIKTLRLNSHYLRSLATFFGSAVPISSIDLGQLRAWRRWLITKNCKYGGAGRRPIEQAPLSPHTVHGHIRVARQFFAWLAREGYVPENPAAGFKQVPLPQCLPKAMTDEDFEKMLEVAKGDSPERVRLRAMLLFLASTGGRLGGCLTLTVERLDLAAGEALVVEKGRGGGKARVVYLTPSAAGALDEWLRVRTALSPQTDRVFVTVPNQAGQGGGTVMSDKAVYAQFARAAKRAGVKGRFNPHALRHRLGKRMLSRGASLGQVSRLLGHSDIRVTDMFYGVFARGELKEAHRKFA